MQAGGYGLRAVGEWVSEIWGLSSGKVMLSRIENCGGREREGERERERECVRESVRERGVDDGNNFQCYILL